MNSATPETGLDVLTMSGEAQERACAALMAASDPWMTLGQDFDSLLRTVRLPGRERYVAHVNGRLAGFLLLNLQGTFAGYIQTIGMAPEFRGQGYGTQLIAFAEQRILRDHQNVFLCVSSFNRTARRLYASLGYREVGELTDFLVAGYSEFLLRKTVGPLNERNR
jgi:ribosomal-protein-alanine N-acetyltransferase